MKIKDHPVLKKINSEINENKIISDLEKEYNIDELLYYDEYTIGEKLQENAYLVENFRLMAINEKHKLQKIEKKLSEKTGEIYDYYKYQDPRDLTKQEIERYYLPSNKELIKLKKMYEIQEHRVNYFEALCEAFKTQGFNMKHFLDNLKIGG
ncbi:MAG: hypothetical protein ACOCP8_01570 [archaeon]